MVIRPRSKVQNDLQNASQIKISLAAAASTERTIKINEELSDRKLPFDLQGLDRLGISARIVPILSNLDNHDNSDFEQRVQSKWLLRRYMTTFNRTTEVAMQTKQLIPKRGLLR